MSTAYPNEHSRLLAYGPFAGCVDPWAEDDHYFNQVHGNIIAEIMGQLNPLLIERGYYASRETSLQIAEYRKPDIAVRLQRSTAKPSELDYVAAATAIAIEPGIDVKTLDSPLDAVYITHRETLELVTVIEIVSPRNKASAREIDFYRDNRQRLFVERSVNVVEIDLTRSLKRLTTNQLTIQYPYSVAIHIAGDTLRVVGNEFLVPVKSIAVPLREDVVPANLQAAYDAAYQRAGIAVQLYAQNRIVSYLPLISTLTDFEQQECLARVTEWHNQLAALSK